MQKLYQSKKQRLLLQYFSFPFHHLLDNFDISLLQLLDLLHLDTLPITSSFHPAHKLLTHIPLRSEKKILTILNMSNIAKSPQIHLI